MNYTQNNLNKKLEDPNRRFSRISKKFTVGLAVLLSFALILTAVFGGYFLYGSFRSLIAQADEITFDDVAPENYYTTIYDCKGKVIDKLVMAGSNREEVSLSKVPDNLINAFVAIEDERYWIHNGIDLKGIIRAAGIAVTTGTLKQGASTITQQLIKNNVFDGGSEKSVGSKVERKLQEQFLAVALEKKLSKNVILENYLNTINLGSNCLGIQSAAKRYFGKDVSELTLSECAVIAAITKNPTANNPIRFPETNQKRQVAVLENMKEQGYITNEEYTEALADDVYSRILTVSSGSSSSVYSYFTDAVIEEVIADLQRQRGYTQTQAYNLLYSGGLSIYTTMDSSIQSIVDKEVNDPDNYPFEYYSISYQLKVTHSDGSDEVYNEASIKKYMTEYCGFKEGFDFLFDSVDEAKEYIEKFKAKTVKSTDKIVSENLITTLEPQVSLTIIDQSTGQVKAISGGRGTKTTNLALNRATQSTRQPGSTFKVLSTFAPALDSCGDTLASVYYDSPVVADGQNFSNWWGDEYLGYVNLRDAIAYSMNLPSLHCMLETVSIDLAYSYVEKFGITTLVDYQQSADGTVLTDHVASLALGGLTKGVTNLELTAAYASIANDGEYIEPTFYTRILNHDGTMLLESSPSKHSVIKASTAELLTLGMESTFTKDLYTDFTSINPNIKATGSAMKLEDMSYAGKSGSTTDNNDLWFVGYSPYYTCSIWSGYDKGKTVENSYPYHKDIWTRIMNQIHETKEDIGWKQTEEIVAVSICSKCGKLAVAGVCDKGDDNAVIYNEYFLKGTEPTELCICHEIVKICKESGKRANEFCPEDQLEEVIYMTIDKSLLSDEYDTDDSIHTIDENDVCDLHHEPEITTEEPTTEEETEKETKRETETKKETETQKETETKTESETKKNN